MKKLTLLVLSLFVGFGLMAQISDDFESYTAGMRLAEQNPTVWTTWSNAPGGSEDPFVSDDVANSGSNSFVVEAGNDCVLPLGDLTTGNYNFTFKIYVPTGYIGYYNVLHMFDGANSEWGTQVYFGANGAGLIDGGEAGAGSFTYAYDTWITVENKINLTFDQATVAIDGVDLVTWQWSMGTFGEPGLNQLGAANFYAWDEEGTPKFYIDDVELIDLGGGGVGEPPVNLVGEVIDDFYIELNWDEPGAASALWDQLNTFGETYGKTAQDFEAAYDAYDAEVAADFVLEADATISSAAFGFFVDSTGYNEPLVINVGIFPDEGGVPGETALYSTTTEAVAADENGIYTANLVDPISLTAGTYWIGYNMQLSYDEVGQCYANQRDAIDNDTPAYWRNPGDGFGSGFTTWTQDVASQGGAPQEVCFAIYGETATAKDLANMNDFNNILVEKNFQAVDLAVSTTAKTDNVAPANLKGGRELLGYNVYRGGEVIAEEISATTYLDGELEPGAYTYLVTAVYTEGESEPAGPITIEITAGVPVANITPNVLSGGLVYFGQTAEKQFNVANDGNGDLMFEVFASYNSDAKTFVSAPYNFSKAPEGVGELVSVKGGDHTSNYQTDSRELLWDNADINILNSGLISGGYGGVGASDNLVNCADDFVVPSGEEWSIEFIHTEGFTTEEEPAVPDGFGVIFYSDAFGAPGDVIYEEIVPWTNYDAQDLVLAMPQTFSAGHYWISVYVWFEDATEITNHRWNWYYGTTAIGHEAVLQDQPGFFGGMNWTKIGPEGLGTDGKSFFFVIEGTKTTTDNWMSFDPETGTVLPLEDTDVTVTIDPMGILNPANIQYSGTIMIYTNDPDLPVKNIPIAMQLTSVGIGEEEATYVMVYPNPATSVMNIQANENIKNIRVMNLAGQTVVSTAVDAERYQINASDFDAGIYFVQIETDNGITTQKITVQ
jgi:LEA14-like dessication related protein